MTVNIDMSGAIEATETAMQTLRDNLKSQFASLQAELTAQNQGIATSVQQVFATMSQTALSIVAQMVTQMAATVSGMSGSFAGVFDSITGAATEKVQALYNSALTILNSLAASSVSTVQKMANNVSEVFAYIQTTTVAISTQMSSQIMTIINAMTNSFLTAIKIFSSSLLNAFEAMRVKIVASINNMKSQVVTATSAMVSLVKSTVSTMPTFFYGIGQQMMSQLAKGITASMSTATGAAATVVATLISTFRTGLGIASPSKVMIWIGQMMLAGLIKGMSKDQIIAFTSKYVDEMKNSFNSGDIKIGTMIQSLGTNGTNDLISYLAKNGDSDTIETIAQAATVFPLPGSLDTVAINSYFGYRESSGVESTYHQGIDLDASTGTPIYAVSDGTISIAGWYGGYGNAVQVDHNDSTSTLYGHMSSVATSVGSSVKAGQVIGYVGSTGNSTGPHLHFSLIKNGSMVDPLSLLQGAESITGTTTLTLSQALTNALTLLSNGKSYSDIDAMGSNVVARTTTTNAEEASAAITTALNILGMYSSENLASLMSLAAGESGYDSSIDQQIVDINTYLGTPAKGLMQVIQPTFENYKVAGYDDIYDAVANTLASIKYQLATYGHLVSSPGYSVGSSYIPEDMLAMLHKGEVVLPVSDVERLQNLANPSNPYKNFHGNILDTVLNMPGSRDSGTGIFGSGVTSQGASGQDIYITVVSELDGRQVAKSTAKYVQTENEWQETRMNRMRGTRG